MVADVDPSAIKRVVIAGGGTAGWITAAALSSQLGPLLDITLIESDAIGTIGVGEATIPTHKTFHHLLGIDEADFMRACGASFKLGIAFENWGGIGQRYIHAFGQVGKSTWMGDFQHMWHQARAKGFGGVLDDYCLELQAAEAGKFETSQNALLSYAYHLDASLYAQYLRRFAETRGVRRIEGEIVNVRHDPVRGLIQGLALSDGNSVDGDFFIDCTGFRAVLIGQALSVAFVDWSHWLPMDRAVVVQTEGNGQCLPYTRSIARPAGWQWRIPLQHRTGNGHVFASAWMSDDAARAILVDNLDGRPVGEPRLIRFSTGRRACAWHGNCVALGLASGFLEPLESTSIHLVQIGITRLIQMFPFNGVNDALIAHYNSHFVDEMDGIRDFLILHYKLTQRDDTDFWKDRQALDIPQTLAQRMALYRETAMTYQHGIDLFRADSWLQVMHGQGLESRAWHHMGRLLPPEKLRLALDGLRTNIAGAVAKMPMHRDFLMQYCGMKVP